MLRVVGEDGRLERPMLVELRGELYEVARHAGAREGRVLHVGEHAVQRVAELVEHRGDVGDADQRRLAGGRLGEVCHVEDHRLGSNERALVDKCIHPRAAALVRAREVVGIEESERLAVGIEDFEHPHVGVVDRNVVALFEGEAVQPVRSVEDSVLPDAVQLEVLLHLAFVERVLRLAQLFRVVLPIPRRELESAFLFVDQLLHGHRLLAGLGRRGEDHVGHQLDGDVRGLGHLIVEDVRGKGGKPEELRFLGAELGQAFDDGLRVVRPAVIAALRRGGEKFLAQGAVLQEGQRRLLRRVLESEDVFAGQPAILGPLRCGGDVALAQAGQIGFVVDDDRRCIGIGEDFLTVLGGESRFFLIQRPKRRLVRIGELRAGADEVAVVALDEILRLRIEVE